MLLLRRPGHASTPSGGPAPRSAPARFLATVAARITPLDVAALAAAIGAWLVAYAAGGWISVWRSESFVVLAVLLLRRLRPWTLVVPVLAACYVAWGVSLYFANGQLI